ncbi:Alpha-methylacyl-CoA racemase [Psilocybe cubensis]|uniref:Alpha-methylacyl-CoA racemase n=3 Tax=Psilocybe cubensis TaxID=181762 RepID=A0ACB8H179_PSICU|nr:Alpha-methylacyl-CoA racemase [Psilocybe cubensis]KAH9481454.1 Alpha-methylacyl-CoA racemase [Psilocybe cubensis]
MALSGLKVIEFAGLAPGPFAGMILADNGASVTRIDRPSSTSNDVLCRGKRSIIVDSKKPSGRQLLQELIASTDVLIDPFRPGVLERLGLGPELFLGDGQRKGLNEKLIYARIVGFPRTGALGPHKNMAGHDINYLALSGVLAMLPGTAEKPAFPINILADFAGGGLTCANGILLALIERGRTGRGQVVNSDMVSGTRYLSSFPLIQNYLKTGIVGGPRGTNILDGGSPFYNIYSCQGGGWMSVGCLEPQFFKIFIEAFTDHVPKDFNPLNGWKPNPSTQFQKDEWPMLQEYLTKGFLTRSRDFWTDLFHGTDACTVPILTPQEAGKQTSNIPAFHPQLTSHIDQGKPCDSKNVILQPGTHTYAVLREYGLDESRIRELDNAGVLGNKSLPPSKL